MTVSLAIANKNQFVTCGVEARDTRRSAGEPHRRRAMLVCFNNAQLFTDKAAVPT